MQEHGIDYVLVGPREHFEFGMGTLKFGMLPDRFERVYARDGVEIFRPR